MTQKGQESQRDDSSVAKPRFVIVDHALKSLVGHYYGYDLSVLGAVPRDRFQSMLFCNIDFARDLDMRAIPFFRCDFWTLSRGGRPDAALRGPTKPSCPEASAMPSDRSDSRRRAPLSSRLYHELLDRAKRCDRRYGGHPLVRPLFRLAKRVFFTLQARRWRRLTHMPPQESTQLPHAAPSSSSRPVQLTDADRRLCETFLADMTDLLSQHALGPDDVVFLPNMNHWSLAAIVKLVDQLGCGRLPKLKLLFRRNVFDGPPSAEQYLSGDYSIAVFRDLFMRLAPYRESNVLAFFTDTERLKLEYEVFSPFKFAVLPIPLRYELIRQKEAPGKPLRVVYLGNARSEKGFQYLPDLVQQMRSCIEAGQVEFVVQAVPDPEPEILAAVERLRELSLVKLLEVPLTDEQYHDLLASGDIVLLLYDPHSYYSRSSCVLVEAITSATPFLALDGSWIASEMPPGTGAISRDPSELAGALNSLLEDYSRYLEAIRGVSAAWKAQHDPRRLVERLLSS